MANRNHQFEIDEYYHCFNRGTDKRVIYVDGNDYSYFLRSIDAYNSTEVYGKLRLHQNVPTEQRIVEVISYNLLPNHFHIVLKELTEHGISKFMQRVGVGYTMYFNEKYKRSGALFQGAFKSKHVSDDQNLRQVIAYVTFNHLVHNTFNATLFRSWLNTESDIVRGRTSNLLLQPNDMIEIVEIIKEQRLSFD